MTPTPDDIRAFRDRHGFSQRELAERLGLEKAGGTVTVARWEAGTRTPVAFLALALCEVERRIEPRRLRATSSE